MDLPMEAARGDARPAWHAGVTTAFELYHGRIVGTLVHVTRDRDLAEDLAAEAFARLARAAAEGRVPDDPCAWLHRVALNLVVDNARRTHVARAFAPRLVDAATPVGPEEAAIEHDDAARLRSALQALPAEHQAALVMAAEGWTSREIGDRLGRTDVGVRTILSRARRALRMQVVEAPAA
jgi:RNA polymerase sigma-70 factor (ECF subfamily)